MSGKPVAIDLVPYAGVIGASQEFLRMWVRPDGAVLCFVNPRPTGADPMGFGIALVDAVRHGANAYARATGITEAEAEARIWQGVDAERATPLSPTHDLTDDDPNSPITYDKDFH